METINDHEIDRNSPYRSTLAQVANIGSLYSPVSGKIQTDSLTIFIAQNLKVGGGATTSATSGAFDLSKYLWRNLVKTHLDKSFDSISFELKITADPQVRRAKELDAQSKEGQVPYLRRISL